LTTPDLVVLSLLAERPMHGYEVNAELQRRHARDWVAISRPQIYYSLEKLRRHGLLTEVASGGPTLGAERSVFKTSSRGRPALMTALTRKEWTNERSRPLFLTWLALSWPSSSAAIKRQIQHRMRFLESAVAREQETLRDVLREVGHPYHEAVWMIKLTISQFRTELRWLRRVSREIGERARRQRR
jgi:DNA-binding PadR family transcriptional regulator